MSRVAGLFQVSFFKASAGVKGQQEVPVALVLLQSGHFASVVLPLNSFELPLSFFLFSPMCASRVWEGSLPFLFKRLLVDPTRVLIPRHNTRVGGEGINLKLLLQQLKGPVSVVTSLFFHPEQQQQQLVPPDLSCACEGRALDLLGAKRLARCLQLLAKKRNGIKQYLMLIYLWAVN